MPRQRFGTVYHHIKLHTSQTPRVPISTGRLWDHIKLHISQTRRRAGNPAVRFTTICLSNMPLNFLSSFEACLPYKITYFSNRRERFLIPLKLVYHTKLHTSQTFRRLPLHLCWLVYHTKLHTSQTIERLKMMLIKLVYHTKLHTSQTNRHWLPVLLELVYHTKLHTSQTDNAALTISCSLVYHTKLHTSQTKFRG